MSESEIGTIQPNRGPYCECCDHPLQHAIRQALAMDAAPIPYSGRTHQAIMANLKAALDEWEESVTL